MSLFCCLGRVSSSVLKGPVSDIWKNKLLIKPVYSVSSVRQYFHHTVISPEKRDQDSSALPKFGWKADLRSDIVRRFSTSPSLLAQHKSHDHSKLWTFERFLSVALLPVIPAALTYPSQSLDAAMAVLVVLHTHFGLEAIVVDYVRPILFGDLIPKISLGLLYLFSIVTLAGLLNLIYNDAGLANTIITIWKK